MATQLTADLVSITSRVPVGNDWMVCGQAALDADCYITGETLGFRKALHVVYVNGKSTTVTENMTSAILNSNNGTADTLMGSVWFNNATTVDCDFCVIGR